MLVICVAVRHRPATSVGKLDDLEATLANAKTEQKKFVMDNRLPASTFSQYRSCLVRHWPILSLRILTADKLSACLSQWHRNRLKQAQSSFNKRTRKIVLTMNITRLGLLFFLVIVAAASAQTVWTDATGDWFNSANWSAGVPTSSTAAQINNGGTAQIATSGAMAGDVTLGFGSLDSGTLSASVSGTLDNGSMYVGESGTGTLNITSGGVVSSGRFIIGDNSGSNGTATVSGAGSTWNNLVVCFVGFAGTGALNINSGGQVSNFSQASIGETTGSVGMVTVDGTGSSWTPDAGVTVGGNGRGTLTITNGGTVSSPIFGNGVVGNNPGSTGTVNISGAGSTWTNSNALVVGGNGGTGMLHISSGGAVSNLYGIVGEFSGATGTVTIVGTGSNWTNSGDLFVGSNGGVGMVTITNGGQLLDANGNIGFGSFFFKPSGTVTVDGAGSIWTNSGDVNIGATGTGTLDVRNGGTVSATRTFVDAGGTLQGTGTVTTNLVKNGGTVSPGDSPGTLTIMGRYNQQASGTLMIDIAGASWGQFSVLDVTGTANLTGTLDPVLSGGFVPSIGEQFVFLESGLRSGRFSGIQNKTFNGGTEVWEVIYKPNEAILTAVSPSAVPDRGSAFLLLTLSLLGLTWFRRRLV